jgi:predicted nuclease of predicted toxin-antitoxin system
VHFLLDAHIPRRLCQTIRSSGHECTHVETLERGNASSDATIASRADEIGAVVVTKDDDFRISHRFSGRPERLLLVTIGNCSNDELARMVELVLDPVVQMLQAPGMAELRRETLILTPLQHDVPPSD